MARRTTPLPPLLVLISIPVALSAQPDSKSDTGVYCRVSSAQVVAGTSDQGATLDSVACTEKFRRFVSETVSEVRNSYEAFFEVLRADPKTIDALSRLIARKDLLATDWIARSEPSVSHTQSASASRLLDETNTLLQEQLTQEDFALLQKYKNSIPTRELIKPVISRLQLAGIPPSSEQLERAVEQIQSWANGLIDRAEETHDPSCERQAEIWNGREAELLAILSESLDEEQASVARDYYRERAEQRKKELENHRARTGHTPCAFFRSEADQSH